MSQIATKIRQIEALIAKDHPKAQLLVVTKSHSAAKILEVIKSGAKMIGENRVQEADKKFKELSAHSAFNGVQKHLIGHLQSNKVKDAVRLFDVIQSVDSLRIATKISTESAKINKVMPIFLEVNISDDMNKHGFKTEEILLAAREIEKLANVKISGLMTITENHADHNMIKRDFERMKLLFDQFSESFNTSDLVLSMGMSNDYQMALDCGSTMVRVGSFIFS